MCPSRSGCQVLAMTAAQVSSLQSLALQAAPRPARSEKSIEEAGRHGALQMRLSLEAASTQVLQKMPLQLCRQRAQWRTFAESLAGVSVCSVLASGKGALLRSSARGAQRLSADLLKKLEELLKLQTSNQMVFSCRWL